MTRHHLISGGGGFIGSHLCDALLAAGDRVTVVDSFVTGRRANLAHLAGHDRVTVVEHDITEPLPAALTAARFDTVLHLASPASPVDFRTMPLEILEVGSTGTRRMLQLATDQGARLLLASTSEVYGDPLVHPQPESYLGNVDSIGPRSCYDESKRFAEALTMAFHRTLGTDVRIVRIFNTYGERMRADDGRVVSNFVVAALQGEPLHLYGDGTQTRSFCHVDDLVRGLRAVLDDDEVGPVNVGNEAECTMLELAETVIELAGSSSALVVEPLPYERTGDPARRRPDLTVLRERHQWQPEVDLRTGLQRMIDWFRATGSGA
ncbi:MAG: NAD-dependent epimerase/dehydratase family protein [Ilumatobacteraceae bacterium]